MRLHIGSQPSMICTAVLLMSNMAYAQDEDPPQRPEVSCDADRIHAQKAETENRLIEARAAFETCSDNRCVEAENCRADRVRLDKIVPSVRFHTATINRSRISVDAGALMEIPTTPLVLDPGRHVVRYETESGTMREVTFVLRAGEQQREVELETADDERPRDDGCSAGPVVLAGVGGVLALAGVGLLLTLSSVGQQSDSRQKAEEARGVQRAIGYTLLAVGGAGVFGGGSWYAATRPCGK